jgi:hypothetical protein
LDFDIERARAKKAQLSGVQSTLNSEASLSQEETEPENRNADKLVGHSNSHEDIIAPDKDQNQEGTLRANLSEDQIKCAWTISICLLCSIKSDHVLMGFTGNV